MVECDALSNDFDDESEPLPVLTSVQYVPKRVSSSCNDGSLGITMTKGA